MKKRVIILTTGMAIAVIAVVGLIIYFVKKYKYSKKDNQMKTISNNGLDLIKEFEGFSNKAYQCSAGVWTIGYGHTLGVKQGDTCTKEQATAYLQSDCSTAESTLNSQNLCLSQNQFDALVSLIFNIGTGAFLGSTLLKKAKVNVDDPTIENEFLRWNKVGKTAVAGLTKRRQKEADLYFS